MNASHNPPGAGPPAAAGGQSNEAVRRDGRSAPGSPAYHENLVIENLSEFAAAGAPGFCVGACWSDYAASPVPA